MATEVFEQSLSIEIDVLESVPLAADSNPAWRQSYPYPWLQLTGRRQSISARTVVVENPYLMVVVLPDLGGRIYRIFDKRTGTEILDLSSGLRVVEDLEGPRGLSLRSGIEWSLVGRSKWAMEPVVYQVVEPPDDGSPAGLWLTVIDSSGLSGHLGLSLPPDRAIIEVELRVFNRTLTARPLGPQLRAWNAGDRFVESEECQASYDRERGAGLGFWVEPTGESRCRYSDGTLELIRVASPKAAMLGPRQMDCWRTAIVPVSGLPDLTALSRMVALSLDRSELATQAVVDLEGCKIVLDTENGAFEANAALGIAEIYRAPFVELPKGVSILSPKHGEVLRWPGGLPDLFATEATRDPGTRVRALDVGLQKMWRDEDPMRELAFASLDMGVRAAAQSATGIWALRSAEYERAATCFEEALLYNAEDHLTWWMKAVAERHAGRANEDSPELPNAHYLAPLEPALRAEAFLRQPSLGADPSPILRPLNASIDMFVEVACQLHDCGLREDLARWVDEALRHMEVPMLRYILADALLTAGTMRAEAASQIRSAARGEIQTPCPWRETELRVLERLQKAFPEDSRLAEIRALVEWARAG